jgi:4a-hydroxytetrahydrobiopterin dehydratase
MKTDTVAELKNKKCKPCEGGVPPVERAEAERLLENLPGWTLAEEGKQIRRKWTVKDFGSGMEFLNRVAELAESENHHPDLYLTGYRNVTVELTTHAIDGLSENDFILAAKIADLPVRLKGK